MGYSTIAFDPRLHRDALLELWKRNMSNPRIPEVALERYRWFYNDNPVGEPVTNLLVDDTSGTIVGCGSFFPRRMFVGGRRYTAGILSDFAVDAAHRSAGPAVALQRSLAERATEGIVDFLVTYPNLSAAPIFKRIGYKAVGTTQTWVKPLRSVTELRKRVPAPGAALAAPVVDFGLFAWDAVRQVAESRRGNLRFRAFTTDHVDERFEHLQPPNPAVLSVIGERSRQYLTWRYERFPLTRYSFFGLADDGLIAGYVAYQRNGDVAIIADVLCAVDLRIEALVLGFAAHARRVGCRSVRADLIGPEAFGTVLRKLGFYRRVNDRSLLTYFASDVPENIKSVALNADHWLMFDAELDI
jgi:hypothetical protein